MADHKGHLDFRYGLQQEKEEAELQDSGIHKGQARFIEKEGIILIVTTNSDI